MTGKTLDYEEDDEIWALLDGSALGGAGSQDSDEEDLCCKKRAVGEGIPALCAEGLCRLDVPLSALAPLRKLAGSLLEDVTWLKVLDTEGGHEIDLGPSFPRLYLHYSVGAQRLLWLYAGDEAAMKPFEGLAAAVLPALEAAAAAAAPSSAESPFLHFCAGSLVVLRAPGARRSEVSPHRDWDEPGLPACSAFTVLAPLLLPEGSAGLEIFDAGGASEGVADYIEGGVLALDNKRLHRTSPTRSPTRVLASLSFAPTRADLWLPAERVLRGQTPHFFRKPCGSPLGNR